jgi:hypothetical protein
MRWPASTTWLRVLALSLRYKLFRLDFTVLTDLGVGKVGRQELQQGEFAAGERSVDLGGRARAGGSDERQRSSQRGVEMFEGQFP